MSQNIAKLLVLYVIAILFTILNLNSIGSLGGQVISLPLFEVMMIYYFAIFKHRIFGFWFIFIIGFWADAINGVPLGMTSLVYLIVIKVFYVIEQKQSPKEDFKSVMKEFVAFISAVLLFKWFLISIYHNNFYNIIPIIAQIAISSVVYILVHKFFDFLTKKLLEE